jgi:hypothetical protein
MPATSDDLGNKYFVVVVVVAVVVVAVVVVVDVVVVVYVHGQCVIWLNCSVLVVAKVSYRMSQWLSKLVFRTPYI